MITDGKTTETQDEFKNGILETFRLKTPQKKKGRLGLWLSGRALAL